MYISVNCIQKFTSLLITSKLITNMTTKLQAHSVFQLSCLLKVRSLWSSCDTQMPQEANREQLSPLFGLENHTRWACQDRSVAGFSLTNYISAKEACDWTGKGRLR